MIGMYNFTCMGCQLTYFFSKLRFFIFWQNVIESTFDTNERQIIFCGETIFDHCGKSDFPINHRKQTAGDYICKLSFALCGLQECKFTNYYCSWHVRLQCYNPVQWGQSHFEVVFKKKSQKPTFEMDLGPNLPFQNSNGLAQ